MPDEGHLPSWGLLDKDDLITTKRVDELVKFASLVGKAIIRCLCREFIPIGAQIGADRQMEVAQGHVDVYSRMHRKCKKLEHAGLLEGFNRNTKLT
jgi:hypothetical protein